MELLISDAGHIIDIWGSISLFIEALWAFITSSANTAWNVVINGWFTLSLLAFLGFGSSAIFKT